MNTEYVLHSIADRETAGLTLGDQPKILVVNAICLVSKECFVVKLAEGSYLVSYYNAGRSKTNQNSLKSRFNSSRIRKNDTIGCLRVFIQ